MTTEDADFSRAPATLCILPSVQHVGTRVLGLSVGEDFVILACVVFTQCHRVTDRQTDIPII